MTKVAILMATKNGQEFILEQLKSIFYQKNVKIDLYISDDKSTDETLKIINNFKLEHPNFVKRIYRNKFNSASKNFHFLINKVSKNYDYYGFSDQDDIWEENKIVFAINKIKKGYDLYGSRTNLIDKKGLNIGKSLFFSKKPSFENSLVQNIAGGNTMVLSKRVFLYLKKLKIKNSPSYDWFIYIFTSFKGYKYYYDLIPKINYRQHDNNDVGSNLGFLSQLKRILMTLEGRFLIWSNEHIKLLLRFKDIGNMQNQNILRQFILYRKSLNNLIKDLLNKKFPFYRQTKRGHLMMIVAFILRLI